VPARQLDGECHVLQAVTGERVVLFRAVDADAGDAVADIVEEVPVLRHRWPLPIPSPRQNTVPIIVTSCWRASTPAVRGPSVVITSRGWLAERTCVID